MATGNAEIHYANVLRSVGGNGPSVADAVDFVQGRRSNRVESHTLDKFFIEELVAKRAVLEELRERQERLREKHGELVALIDRLSAPPLHEAVYVEADTASGRTLAKVAHGGGRRLVEVGDDVDLEQLAPGDVVFLSSQLNFILGTSSSEATRAGEIATVERCTTSDRLVIRDRDAEVVIDVAVALRDTELKPGDQVLWSRDVMMAFEAVSPADSNPSFVDIEQISGGSPQPLGGLDVELQRIIALFTESFSSPSVASLYQVAQHNKSLLMVGPPGCGKTSIARSVAYEAALKLNKACRFASVNGTELESPWVGETQRNVRGLFRALAEYEGPTILYIDEVESIARHRGTLAGHHSDKFLSQWLTSLDGFKRRDGVAVIASTNRKDLIDPALLERISGTEVHIGRPSMDSARDIFGIHLPESIPYRSNGAASQGTREALIEHAVSRLYEPNAESELAVVRFRDGKSRAVTARELASGRAFEQICIAARQRAFERHASGGEAGVCHEDLEEAVADALDKLATTLSVRNVRHFVSDLPQDVDVVAVEPVRRRVRRHRYMAG